jgi:hypothetical protein
MDLLQLQHDPKVFRESLLIDTDSGPRPLSECIDPWQEKDFAALDDGWKRAVMGTSQEATYQRGWLERPRGHSKSLDLAIMATWALFSARRPLSGFGAAGDQDQARLLRDAIGRLCYCNPWLLKILEVQINRVVNTRTQSTLEIISSDAPTSYGLTPDFVIADEITHWQKRDLWDSLLSSSAKRSTCMLVCITNAGLSDDWQWDAREKIRTDPKWFFSRLDGPVASWITPDRLQEQERLLPNIAYRRLWLNEWTSGGGDALTQADIDAAFLPDLRPQTRAQEGYTYVGGLDLGVSRDASAICILAIRRGHEGHGRIRLAFTRLWRPRKGTKINLQEIEDSLVTLHSLFNLKSLCFDPWQALHMAQRLQAAELGVDRKQLSKHAMPSKVPMREVVQSGQNLQRIASIVIEAFADRRLELFDDPDLRRDCQRFRIEERPYGFRLTSPRDGQGHGDLGASFCLAMLGASELAGKRQIQVGVITAPETEGATPLQRAALERMRIEQLINTEVTELWDRQGHKNCPPGWEWLLRRCKRL